MKFASTILVIGLSTVCLGYSMADFTEDGIVDFLDFSVFGNEWLQDPNTLPDNTTRRKTGGTATFVIAASDSPANVKARADYVCDGIDDEVEIKAAIDSLPLVYPGAEPPRYGGTIYFAEGVFNISSPIICSNDPNRRMMMSLIGSGGNIATQFRLTDSANCSILQIGYDPRMTDPDSTDAPNSDWVDIRNIMFSGNADRGTEHVYDITAVSNANKQLAISGDATGQIKPFDIIRVHGSTLNDGFYAVEDCVGTVITVLSVDSNPFRDETADGKIKADPPLINAVGWGDSSCDHCFIHKSIGDGVIVKHSWTLNFDKTIFEHCRNTGLMLHPCGNDYGIVNVNIDKAVFLNNKSDAGGTTPSATALLVMSSEGAGCMGINITDSFFRSCWKEAITLDGQVNNIKINGNTMYSIGYSADDTYYGIRLKEKAADAGPSRIRITNNIIDCTDVANDGKQGAEGRKLKAAIGLENYNYTAYPDWVTISGNLIKEGKSFVPWIENASKSAYRANLRGKLFNVVTET